MKFVVRNPDRARDYALIGGLGLVNLDVICAFLSRSSQWPAAILIGAWVLLVALVAWKDEEVLRDWWACWFIGILLLYLTMWGGWTMVNLGTPSSFRPDGAVMAVALGAWPAVIFFLLIRWLVLAVLSRCRRFVGPDECHGCGYSLRGLDTPRCPECGRPFESTPPSVA